MAGQVIGFILASVFSSAIWFFIVGLSDMGEFKVKGSKAMVIVGVMGILGFWSWLFFMEM